LPVGVKEVKENERRRRMRGGASTLPPHKIMAMSGGSCWGGGLSTAMTKMK